MKRNSDLLIRTTFWLSIVAVACVGVFFILNNAYWLVADDAIVIRHTGWGIPFKCADGTIPLIGRFFPFAYLPYNICLLFCDGLVSPKAHYLINAFGFLVFVGSLSVLALRMVNNTNTLYKYFIAICFVAVAVEITYPMFILVRSTMWVDYTLVALFVLLCHCFYKSQKWIYGLCALLCINYFCYCLESNFLFPLTMGGGALIIGRMGKKNISKRDFLFSWLLICSGLLYLVLYCILVLPYVTDAYDSSHGASMGVLGNAFKMICECKMLVLILIVFFVRLIDTVKNKTEYTFFDVLLIMAVSCCCGGFALRFNLNNYYILYVLIGLPAVLYYSQLYLKGKMAIVLWPILFLLFIRPVGSQVKHNQRDRKETWKQVNLLSNKINEAKGVFCYEPIKEEYSYDVEIRTCKYNSICTYLGWLRHDMNYSITRVPSFAPVDNTVWLNALENEVLFPEDKELELYGERFYWAGWVDGYWVTTERKQP